MKNLTLVFLTLTTFCATAQFSKNVEDGLFKINALAPGVSYELGVGSNITINAEAFLGFALFGGTDRETRFGLYPGIAAEFRYYTNMNRRLGKNRNISGNSGNYVGLLNQYQFGTPVIGDLDFASDFFNSTAIVYGIQRTRSKGFYWGLAFGPGVFVDEFETNTGLLIDVRLGWVIGKGKKK